jgi:hypothetical protein
MKREINNNNLKEGYNSLLKVVEKWWKEEKTKNEFRHLNTEKVDRVIYKASTYGWYFDDFSKTSKIDINKCLKYIYNNLPEKLDLYLSNYYTNKLATIKNGLNAKYPKRKSILNQAFQSHENGMYYSSICLLITQIDGICQDIFNAKFFINKSYLPEIKVKLDKKKIKYSDFLLSVINKKAIINSWEKEIDQFPIRLNRHEIIHGVDTSYGTELNSLKIISMLTHIDYIINHFKSN